MIRATNVSIANIAGTAIMRRPMKVCDRFCGRWGRTGSVTMSQISPDFQRRCMHLDEYVHQVEERIAGENVRLGWHNRMSENRRVMAEQMKEIAVALKSFTINLGETEELPKRAKTKNFRRIKKRGYQGSTFIGEKKGADI